MAMRSELTTAAGAPFVIDWAAWRASEEAVLCFLRRADEMLLILKKRGLGAGKFNAPGGRIEAGETPVEAAIRETREEVGLTPLRPRPAGRLNFAFVDGYHLRCHLFVTESFTGEAVETDEAIPFWQRVADPPYTRMWSDDRLWLPLLLAGRSFEAWFVFDGELMLWYQLRLD